MTSSVNHSSRKSFLSGLLFLLLASVGWLVMQNSLAAYQGSPIRGDPGPFFLIELCISSLAILGVVLVVHGIIKLHQSGENFFPASLIIQLGKRWSIPAAFVVSLLLMPILMKWIGTIYSVALFAIVWIYSLISLVEGWSLKPLFKALAYAIAVAFFIELIFVRLLILPLP